jgi:TorA maturation chaperone TorD
MIKADQSKMSTDLVEWCEAISQDLTQIAVLHDREADSALINALREVDFPNNLGLVFELKNEDDEDDRFFHPQKFVENTLREFSEEISQDTLDWLAVDYADIYLNHSLHASPFESVWLDEDHLLQQEPMFKIRDWYKRYGLVSANWRTRSDDHLVLQLQFIAWLLNPDSSSSETIPLQKRLEDAARFMDEHLLLWLSDFSYLVSQRCGTDFYAATAVLTQAYINQLRDQLANMVDVPRPSAEELEEMKLKATQTVVEEPISFMPGTAESW